LNRQSAPQETPNELTQQENQDSARWGTIEKIAVSIERSSVLVRNFGVRHRFGMVA